MARKRTQPPPRKGPASNRKPAVSPPPEIGQTYTGIYQSAGRRGGFVVLESSGVTDVYVPHESCGPAMHGDQVRALVLHHRRGRASVGEIERVLRHANKRIIGQISRSRRISVVRPKNPRLTRIIEIHRQFDQNEVPDGSWVEVEIKRWSSSPREALVGSLIEVLGLEGERRLPILLLIREKGVRPEFPAEVEAEAEKVRRREISETEIARRRDWRGRRIVTIDPATAKDFDDAVELIESTRDGWRVAVHIADVAHYVPPGSKIDSEAFERATSIYPVDRVIPMLPEALSNELCSLRPGEDKLAMSVLFTIDRKGAVRDAELAESVIHSVRRFSYEEIQGLFDDMDGVEDSPRPRPEIPHALAEDLFELRRAAAALLRRRSARGSLDLDLPETEVLFDEEGIVTDLRRKERFESHRLIEDFMIAANEAVARELTEAACALLYRIHEPPDEAKLEALRPALSRFGIHIRSEGALDQSEINAALAQARRHPAGHIVQRWVLRATKRAYYGAENKGHWGLASECYCHFTSPIRRYPDLVVHRAVKALLGSRDAYADGSESAGGQLAEWGRHTSSREERAQRIEWDALKILTLEFMRRHLGDVFEGFISGVRGSGFFVELIRYPAEGFVPIKSLEEDYFDLDDAGAIWRGRRTGASYGLGDRVRIQIERIDVLAGEMDLNLVRADSPRGGRDRKPKPPYNWKKHVRGGRRRK